MATVIREGIAECILEPRGDSGLEGYQSGSTYRYQYMDRDKNGKPYYRVYPSEKDSPGEYETCGPSAFHQYFKEIT